jgi:uncharacterized RDD family membrane protein YckC
MPPGYQAYGAGAAQFNYASWGARVGGFILNGLAGALFGLPALIALLAGPRKIESCNVQGYSYCRVPTGGTWAIFAVLLVAGMVTFIVLYSKAVGSTGQFWGHKAAGVRIVDANTGGPIGSTKAFFRYLLSVVNSAPCYLGYLWPLWDQRHQTFTDKIFGTVSVRA